MSEKVLVIIFCGIIILLSGCIGEPKPVENKIFIDENTTVECIIYTYQDDWKCNEPCSCLFVEKRLVCNSGFTKGGIVENVYSDLNREAWVRCNNQLTKDIIEREKNQVSKK